LVELLALLRAKLLNESALQASIALLLKHHPYLALLDTTAKKLGSNQ
jgi:hypothetical protein